MNAMVADLTAAERYVRRSWGWPGPQDVGKQKGPGEAPKRNIVAAITMTDL